MYLSTNKIMTKKPWVWLIYSSQNTFFPDPISYSIVNNYMEPKYGVTRFHRTVSHVFSILIKSNGFRPRYWGIPCFHHSSRGSRNAYNDVTSSIHGPLKILRWSAPRGLYTYLWMLKIMRVPPKRLKPVHVRWIDKSFADDLNNNSRGQNLIQWLWFVIKQHTSRSKVNMESGKSII